MKERRMVRVDISFDLLIELMSEDYQTGGIIKTTKGLPDDAEFVGSSVDWAKQIATIFFRHDSFDPVPVTAEIPVATIQHERDYTPLNLFQDWLFSVKLFRVNHEKEYQEYFAGVADKTWEYVK